MKLDFGPAQRHELRSAYPALPIRIGPSAAPTLMIQAEWDHDTPPLRSQGLFPALTDAARKQYVLIGEGTHTVMMEKNRLPFLAAVQSFLEVYSPR